MPFVAGMVLFGFMAGEIGLWLIAIFAIGILVARMAKWIKKMNRRRKHV